VPFYRPEGLQEVALLSCYEGYVLSQGDVWMGYGVVPYHIRFWHSRNSNNAMHFPAICDQFFLASLCFEIYQSKKVFVNTRIVARREITSLLDDQLVDPDLVFFYHLGGHKSFWVAKTRTKKRSKIRDEAECRLKLHHKTRRDLEMPFVERLQC
jgi:hypothetical protein